MTPRRLLIVLLVLGSGCTPAMLPRLQVAVAHGDRRTAAGERHDRVVWLRLSWGGRGGRR